MGGEREERKRVGERLGEKQDLREGGNLTYRISLCRFRNQALERSGEVIEV